MESSPHELAQRERLARHWAAAEPAVRAFVFASVRHFADAADVVQQVAVSVTRRFDAYDESRPFVAWALWIARSRIADYWRAAGRARVVFSDEIMDRMADALTVQQPEMSARETALEHCLEKLPERSRRLLDLRYTEARAVQDIAQETRSTPNSVSVLLNRIRSVLADCITARLRTEGV